MRKLMTKKALMTKICIPSIIFVVLLIWTIWGDTALTVSTIKISSNHIPDSFSGFRIAQISDLHNAQFGKNNIKLLELLSENEPDIIVITGDLVDAGLFTNGSTNMIVSRGLGNSIIPIRFNNRPEVIVIELLNTDL